ncbi:peptidylprolyl isomerase [Temperatibacter marinus]|uniref:peptidylprolyl isomerase n=1 Tax=Temperatibacter marinus TaxID=1456591 RepID=A0AA52H9E9_9PROT|nr:peptidylprolyl isomerase [Temperatibacter marinus]WND01568.1 peptidylprolyl isomerase [Temperatibacter marinus]
MRLFVFILIFISLTACDQKEEPNNIWSTDDLRLAVDRKDTKADVVYYHLNNPEDKEALFLIGRMGDEATCQQMASHLKSEKAEIREAVLYGLTNCWTESARLALREFPLEKASPSERRYWAQAFGYHAKEEDVPLLIAAFKKQPETELLYGLMQAIVYSRKNVGELAEMPWESVFALIESDQSMALSLYFVNRLQAIETIIPYKSAKDIYTAAQSRKNNDAQIQALRLLSNYEESRPMFTQMLKGIDSCEKGEETSLDSLYMRRRLAVLQFSPKWEDEAWLEAIKDVRAGACDQAAYLAVVYSLSRGIEFDYAAYINHSAPSIAFEAYAKIYDKTPQAVQAQLIKMLTGPHYYKAWKALNILAREEAGRAVVMDHVNEIEIDAIKTDAEYRLAIAEIPNDTSQRPSPRIIQPEDEIVARLETSQGIIKIKLHSENVAAVHFRDLIKAGGMDGMVWHRIIPNFVAQAGQSESSIANDWHAIRDEWGGQHTVGSVGLATAGRDTGSAQFFINVNYNQHLDGRYTVFGVVVEGLENAFAMMEGDMIVKAIIE